jgi:small subunit ribosomal protein S1
VEIEEGIQGLVHLSELPPAQGENPLQEFKANQEVEARVIEVLPAEKKIRLTLRQEKQAKGKASRTTSTESTDESNQTDLGRLLKEKFEDQLNSDSE